MAFYATNGRNIKSLSIDDVLGAGFEASLTGQQDASPRAYYVAVPFMRRAVGLRANAVAGVPVTLQRGKRDISKRPEFSGLMDNLSALLWKTEFALCLSLYGAYWRRGANGYGLNPTPEWLLPHSCWPYITAANGLEYIRYIRPWGVPEAGRVEMLPLEEVVHFWHPSISRVNWPGEPPGLTATPAAAALANRDKFVSTYFQRGAVKGTLLTVPPTTQQSEREKLKNWWQQVFSGIANAFRTNVISTDVKPVIIGEGLADMDNKELTEQYRQDIAAAFEVPESMMLANAANYATAREERISFYEETVFPSLDLILTAINHQWLRDQYDAELVAHPEQTEAMQDAQVQQAQSITDLVGAPVMTVDEGRAFLGLEPMPKEEEAQPPDESTDYAAMDQEEEAADAEQENAEQTSAKALGAWSARADERATMRQAHRAQRKDTRERHTKERQLARERQIEERTQAQDAGTRLRLVHRHKAELAIVAQRQASERAMLWMMQGSERGRLYDKHAAQRALEERATVTECACVL